MPSTAIAKELSKCSIDILVLNLKLEQKPSYSISELLTMLKNKKNPNHEVLFNLSYRNLQVISKNSYFNKKYRFLA